MCGLSLVAVKGGDWLLWVDFSFWWLFLLQSVGSRAHGFQQLWHVGTVCVAVWFQSLGSVVVAHGLSCSAHVDSSQTRDQTRVPCIGRWILNHLDHFWRSLVSDTITHLLVASLQKYSRFICQLTFHCLELMVVCFYFLNSVRFCPYTIMSAVNNDSFISSFLVFMTFISFSLLVMARVSSQC